jgi:hypothetical protein
MNVARSHSKLCVSASEANIGNFPTGLVPALDGKQVWKCHVLTNTAIVQQLHLLFKDKSNLEIG